MSSAKYRNNMTQNTKQRFLLFATKKIWVVLLGICIFVTFKCLWPDKFYSPLQGHSLIVFDSLKIERSDNIYFIGSNIKFDGHSILLPPIITNRKYMQTEVSSKRLLELEAEGKGKWKVISTNPDSISIESTSNPLNGRYAIKILNTTYRTGLGYVILDNDSTHLVLQKRFRR